MNFAAITPALHPDHAVRGACLREAGINVSEEGMKGQPALQVPRGAGDYVAVQSPRDAHFDSFAAEAQRRIHRLAHGPPESNSLFQLQRNGFGNQLRIQLGLVYFQDVNKDIARGALLQLALELVNLGAFAADDDARARRADDDAHLVARALDPDRSHTPRFQPFLQLRLELVIFQQELVVVALHKPARLPRLGVAEPEPIT